MKKISVLLLLLWGTQVYSESSRDTVSQKLNAIRTMTANFKQRVSVKNREISHSSGTMALSRPGRFLWNTKLPMVQKVVADGHKLWIYDVDLEQVSVKTQTKGLGGTTALFLSGYNDSIAQDFNVSLNGACFDLHAKSAKANFQRVKLTFSKNELTRIELFDQLGQHTDVHLTHIKTNIPQKNELFTFTVPKGVDVVDQ